MASFNRTIIVGYLGRDPEFRNTSNGTAVCDFSMATTERRKVSGETQEITTWFKVTLWGRQAEIAADYCKKGSQVYVSGPLTMREYTDKDGNNRVSLEVNASEIQFLSSNNGGGGGERANDSQPKSSGKQTQSKARGPVQEDEIPF